jgi:hypothetical protein
VSPTSANVPDVGVSTPSDTGRVRGIERVGDVDGDGQKNVHFQRTPSNPMLQG